MKKQEDRPDVYKIIFRAGMWASKSERYYTAFSPQEALLDFYHTFVIGHVHARSVKVFHVEKYDRFADRWDDVTPVCLNDIPKPMLSGTSVQSGKLVFNEI